MSTRTKRSTKSATAKRVKRDEPRDPLAMRTMVAVPGTTAPPIPQRWITRMTYCIDSALNSSATDGQCGTENVWRLNSCFDPDLTGGTHQPYGFDQMAGLYTRYLVLGAEIELTVQNAASDFGVLVGSIQPSTATLSLTGNAVSDIKEKNMGFTIFLPPAGGVRTLRLKPDIARVEGTTSEQLRANTEEYAALTSASPTRTPYLRLSYATMFGTTSKACNVQVKISYITEFFAPVLLSASN